MTRSSVIIPAYNAGAYIGEALESVFAQTRQPDEIIVVDDGSTDDTAAVVARFTDRRVRYRHQAKQGVSTARNQGLNEANGDYITFLDADDRWLPTMLEEQGALLDARPDVVLSFTNFRRFNEATGAALGEQFAYFPELPSLPTEPGPFGETRVIVGDAFPQLVAFWDYPAYTQANCYRRAALGGIRFAPELKRCEDLDFTLRVAARGRVAYNPKVLVEVRRHGENLTADDRRMAADKLASLRLLGGAVHGSAHRQAYHDRLVRGHFDVAQMHLRFGERDAARAALAGAWGVPGSPFRKLKGTLRYALTPLQRSPSR
jgi:glycosyltransferase involved in cell wall biosynthesis